MIGKRQCWLALSIALITLQTGNAKIIWEEDFEIKEKVADQWSESKYSTIEKKVVPAPGIISLDQSKRVTGKQSVRINPDIMRKHGFGDQRVIISCDLPPNKGGVLTAWFYDYNESYAYFSGVEVAGGAKKYQCVRVGVATINPNCLFVEPGYAEKSKGVPAIPRKTGWRKLQFVLDKTKTKSKIRCYVDGRFIAESNRSYNGFKRISLGAIIGMLRFWPLYFDAITLDDDPNAIEKDLFRGVDLTLKTDKIGNVFHAGDEIEIKLKAKNYADQVKKTRITGKIIADNGDFLADTPVLEVEIAPNETKELLVKFPAPNRKGPVFVKFDAYEGDKSVGSAEIGLGIIENPQKIKADKSSVLYSQIGNSVIKQFVDIGFVGNRFGGIRKDPHSWPWVEPKKGKFNWKKTDKEIDELLNKYGYSEVMYTFHSTPFWAADPERIKKTNHHGKLYLPPKNMKDWGDYVEKTVDRYKDKVKYWEIWNEVNTGHYAGNTEEYFQMLKTAYEAIKKADPKATVIGITCSSIDLKFMEKLFKLGALKYIDVLGVHPYPHNRPEIRILPEIIACKKLMAKYGDVKPVWDTEFGFYTAGVGENGRPKDPQGISKDKALGLIRLEKINSDIDVANWSARLLALYLANGYEKAFYHGGHPMKHANGMAKYYTYSLAAAGQELSGSKFVRRIDLGDDDLHAYLFEKNGDNFAVLWTVSGEENVILSLNKPEYELVDLWGNSTKKNNPAKVAELLLSESPIYLKGIDANIASVAKNFEIEVPASVLTRDFTVKIDLRNPNKSSMKGKIILKAPKDWKITPETVEVEIQPSATNKSEFAVTAAPGVFKGNWPLQAEFLSADGKIKLSDNAKVATLIPVSFPRQSKAMILTEKSQLANWENAPAIKSLEQVKMGQPPIDHSTRDLAKAAGQSFWEGEKDLSAAFQGAWDDEFLYLTIKVMDDVIRNQHPKAPYLGDCVELFIDPRTSENRRANINPGKVFHLFFSPTTNGDKTPKLWVLAKGVVDVKSLTPEFCAQKEIDKEFMKIDFAGEIIPDGYLLKLKIPFALFENKKPEPGDSFGFDLALDDQDQENKKRESQAFWMGDKDNHKKPSRFGVIKLTE